MRKHLTAYFAIRSEQEKFWRMIRIVDKWSLSVNWCRVPWDQHVAEYVAKGIFVARYEDLPANAFSESERILSHIGIERCDDKINDAVKKHSFEVAKKRFLAEEDMKIAGHLREGNAGSWRRKPTKEQKRVFCQSDFSVCWWPSA